MNRFEAAPAAYSTITNVPARGMAEGFISSINADEFATLRPNDSGIHVAARR
jgi:hypothetical protein